MFHSCSLRLFATVRIASRSARNPSTASWLMLLLPDVGAYAGEVIGERVDRVEDELLALQRFVGPARVFDPLPFQLVPSRDRPDPSHDARPVHVDVGAHALDHGHRSAVRRGDLGPTGPGA